MGTTEHLTNNRLADGRPPGEHLPLRLDLTAPSQLLTALRAVTDRPPRAGSGLVSCTLVDDGHGGARAVAPEGWASLAALEEHCARASARSPGGLGADACDIIRVTLPGGDGCLGAAATVTAVGPLAEGAGPGGLRRSVAVIAVIAAGAPAARCCGEEAFGAMRFVARCPLGEAATLLAVNSLATQGP
ncbi:hypothetical protein [Streptomyces sp. HNM0574]|uniref:hypothetical protein n=1 Tax=Streptomyces sp. HNM0574 TaxID=2714954 RepID=UPI00146BB05B|nr:hypothetical protein [Streptomyces sp. HNM0574]NLU69076.1 hypothetical protein [Streptomyces sp. HNM0574]